MKVNSIYTTARKLLAERCGSCTDHDFADRAPYIASAIIAEAEALDRQPVTLRQETVHRAHVVDDAGAFAVARRQRIVIIRPAAVDGTAEMELLGGKAEPAPHKPRLHL